MYAVPIRPSIKKKIIPVRAINFLSDYTFQ